MRAGQGRSSQPPGPSWSLLLFLAVSVSDCVPPGCLLPPAPPCTGVPGSTACMHHDCSLQSRMPTSTTRRRRLSCLMINPAFNAHIHGPVPGRESTAGTGLSEQHRGCDQLARSDSVCYTVLFLCHGCIARLSRPKGPSGLRTGLATIHKHLPSAVGDLGGSNSAPWPRTRPQG